MKQIYDPAASIYRLRIITNSSEIQSFSTVLLQPSTVTRAWYQFVFYQKAPLIFRMVTATEEATYNTGDKASKRFHLVPLPPF